MAHTYFHPEHGECEHLRTEGIYWIVRFKGSPHEGRLGPSDRQKLTYLPTAAPGGGADAIPGVPATAKSTTPAQAGPSGTAAAASSGSRWGLGAILDRLGITRGPSSGSMRSSSISSLPEPPTVLAETPSAPRPPATPQLPPPLPTDPESRRLRQAFESLRTGLSPVTAALRPLAVGAEVIEQHAEEFFQQIVNGGAGVVFRGGYGLGKTFNLHLLREMALEQRFCVMMTEIDSHRNQLHKPASVIRSLIKSLSFPDRKEKGHEELVRQVHGYLEQTFNHEQFKEVYPREWPWGLARRQQEHLMQQIECTPLSWLLSDPMLPGKEHLINLLACDPQEPVRRSRERHVLYFMSAREQWPAFNAGTQGDFGSYLVSGIGRLCRLLGYNGLIVLLDEMEKWESLNWRDQSRAGNLLGGLLWAASAQGEDRDCADNRTACFHPPVLEHSRRGGGYPFTTPSRCHLGVGIALTPRGDEGPEADWAVYGSFETIDLPEFTQAGLQEYFYKIYPLYCRGYGLQNGDSAKLCRQALATWLRNPDRSTRLGVRAVMAELDAWRESITAE
jgi:hypothetical protein